MASRLPPQASQEAKAIKETSSTPGINQNESSKNNVSMQVKSEDMQPSGGELTPLLPGQ